MNKKSLGEKLEKDYPWIKYVVIGGMLFMVYRTMKKNGGTLLGNDENLKVSVDTDRMIDFAMDTMSINPKLRSDLKSTFKNVAGRFTQKTGIKT